MMLIRDLIHYDEVDEVIKIRKSGQEEEIVSKFVISDKMRENIAYMFKLLAEDTHKSFNIVGNYGTGKSHFLAFIAALLEKESVRSLVHDEEIRQILSRFKREFAVVKFECPATQTVPLARIFYDQVQEQLEERYDIEIDDIDLEKQYDNKRNIAQVIESIKQQNPYLGLVVIIDEISDFLKQKTQTDATYDLNFLREIGEMSQETDFLYIGAMQEHVFENPRYMEQAENIGRISQRFTVITIRKEDINKVIATRIVGKTANQRLEIEELLGSYKHYFTNLTLEMDKYIDLFPVHPYVISVFEDLPYFENRGIINFVSRNVAQMLGEQAPRFITYDLIFDQIDETHEIRNMDGVTEVVSVVKNLESKVDLLEERFRDDARKLIKALAVLKMLGKSNHNGATVQELANTLLITPKNKAIIDEDFARDNIERIIKNIIRITNGQFISYENGYYFIDIAKTKDYDVIIEKKVDSFLDSSDLEQQFKLLAADWLDLEPEARVEKGYETYHDFARWTSRNSYRAGYLMIGKKEVDLPATYLPKDYIAMLHSPFANHDTRQTQHDELILGTPLNNDLIYQLKRMTAIKVLFRDTKDPVFAQKLGDEEKSFAKLYLEDMIENGYAIFNGVKHNLRDLPNDRFVNLRDVLEHFKSYFLDDLFAERYPKHPKFRRLISERNIEKEVNKALESLDNVTLLGLDSNTQSYLESFRAQKDGKFDSDDSEYVQVIKQLMKDREAEQSYTPLEEVVAALARKPYGVQTPFVYLLLAFLLYNGEIMMIKNGGARLFAADLSGKIKQGLDLFADIKYIEMEKDLPVTDLIRLFDVLGLQAGLVKDKNSRIEAVKELNAKANELKTAWAGLNAQISDLGAQVNAVVPVAAIAQLGSSLQGFGDIVQELTTVRKVADLGKLQIDGQMLEQVQSSLANLRQLEGFFADYKTWMRSGLDYLRLAKKDLQEFQDLAKPEEVEALFTLLSESERIYKETAKLMLEDQRRPLKGKIEQFRSKYRKVYYDVHERAVGGKVNWERLEQLQNSARYKSLNQLKMVKFFSTSEFNSIAFAINDLKKFRCDSFDVDALDTFTTCPDCSFPKQPGQITDASFNERIADIVRQVETFWGKWEQELLLEIGKLTDKMELLEPHQHQAIQTLLIERKLPETVGADWIACLNTLAADLQQKDFNLTRLEEHLLQYGRVLNADQFKQAVQEYVQQLIGGAPEDLVRIVVVKE